MQVLGLDRILGGVCAPGGFLASGVSCGIKEDGALDLALVYSEIPATGVGVFTTNQVKAAPVLLSSSRVPGTKIQAVLVSSGNANAMTGEQGLKDAEVMLGKTEDCLDLEPGCVLVASTGVIGEYLPIEKVTGGIEDAVGELSAGGNSDAAKAVMTTDSYPKELAVEMEIGGEVVRLGGMTKGSGMIHPNMATTITVITTDMPIPPEKAELWLRKSIEWSFNRISVDGDQSTNDTVFLLANGTALPSTCEVSEKEENLFFEALCWLTANLAMSIVKDGEGATKLLRIVINGARDDDSAVKIARAIGNSNLVKAAFYGEAQMWGRIAAAAGSLGIEFNTDDLVIYVGTHKVVSGGIPAEYNKDHMNTILSRDEVEITVEVGQGNGSAYFLTTDLSKEYIEINSSSKS